MSVRVWAWASVAAFSCVVSALFLLRPSGPDLATFDYIGWRVTQGDTLYVDVIEQNFPGAMWLHTLSNLLFGPQLWAFRVLDLALLVIGCGGLYTLARVGGAPAARFIVIPLYQAIYVAFDVWLIGQRDMVATHLLLMLGALQAVHITTGAPRGVPVLLGVGMAMVCLTRPTYLLYLPLLYAVDLWQMRVNQRTPARILSDAAVAVGTLVLVLGLVALVGLRSGALAGWYQAAVLFNAMLYSQSATPMELAGTLWSLAYDYSWGVALALLGTVTWWRRGERCAWACAVSLALAGLVSMLVQGKGFGYHLGALFPAIALFAADFAATTLAQAQARPTRVQRGLAALVCMLVLAGTLKKAHRGLHAQLAYAFGRLEPAAYQAQLDVGLHVSLRDVLRAVAYTRAHTRPDQTVLTWNRAVIINYLAQRKLPTRVATVGMLDIEGPRFAPLEGWRDELERTLRAHPPALIFTYNAQLPQQHALLWGPGSPAGGTALVRAALAQRYRLAARFGALDVYALK